MNGNDQINERGKKAMSTFIHDEIHLTDLSFIQLCQSEYGINRGIYNTIDSWFYQKGVLNIVHRRKIILDFLRSIGGNLQNKKQIKFGHGGLTPQLESYWQFASDEEIKSLTN